MGFDCCPTRNALSKPDVTKGTVFMTQPSKNLFTNAAAYNAYIGRWSRAIAPQFLAWLNIPADQTWLDVGVGTGILTQVILNQASPKKVVGIDLSESYVALARQEIVDPRAEFIV